jgi:hypothetical protein
MSFYFKKFKIWLLYCGSQYIFIIFQSILLSSLRFFVIFFGNVNCIYIIFRSNFLFNLLKINRFSIYSIIFDFLFLFILIILRLRFFSNRRFLIIGYINRMIIKKNILQLDISSILILMIIAILQKALTTISSETSSILGYFIPL